MPIPHQIAVASALKTNDELATLFARLGTMDAPNGRVLTAYRNARRALGDLSSPHAVIETLNELRSVVKDALDTILRDAEVLGQSQAQCELKAYGLGNVGSLGAGSVQSAAEAIMASLDAQIARVKALVLNGLADQPTILGDNTHAGMLSPFGVIAEAARWIGLLASAAWLANVRPATEGSGNEFMRQAVAAIDERTTETCLLINGTVIGMDEPFPLEGDPWVDAQRYGFSAQHLPFHWYCRTSLALVSAADANDLLTSQMRAAGSREWQMRQATGKRVEIHPAHATSRR